jgi:hypothetical protein
VSQYWDARVRAQVSERLGLYGAARGPWPPRPSQIAVPGLLDGPDVIRASFGQTILNRPAPLPQAAQ